MVTFLLQFKNQQACASTFRAETVHPHRVPPVCTLLVRVPGAGLVYRSAAAVVLYVRTSVFLSPGDKIHLDSGSKQRTPPTPCSSCDVLVVCSRRWHGGIAYCLFSPFFITIIPCIVYSYTHFIICCCVVLQFCDRTTDHRFVVPYLLRILLLLLSSCSTAAVYMCTWYSGV